MRRRIQRVAARTNSGLTVIEITISLAIMALVLVNFQLVSRIGTDAASAGLLQASVNDELDLTLDRISLALMGSSQDEISGPGSAPSNSTYVNYASVLGMEDGEPVLGPTEEIAWEQTKRQGTIRWTRTETAVVEEGEVGGAAERAPPGPPPAPVERTITWSRAVPNAYLGEDLENTVDDNGTGLTNEHGLAFTREGAKVEIHLTVEHVGDGGETMALEKKHRITCRN